MTAITNHLHATRHLFRHQFMRTRRIWWTVIVSGLANPTLFLLAIGAGLGSQIENGELIRLGTDSYVAWLGPGVLAVTAMEIGSREAMWPSMGMLRWEGTYRAIIATPLSVGQLSVAHVAWIGFRGFVAAACFLVVLLIGGLVASSWGLAVPFVAALVALAHAGPFFAYTATLEQEHGVFPLLQRTIVFPLFLFSGAFFPVEDLPAVFEVIARATPSWHGVEAARDLTLGRADAVTVAHVAYLLLWAGGGLVAARHFLRKSMIT